MSVTFTPAIPQNATPAMMRQAYERLGLSLGIPPQVAQKIYKGQNLDNPTICKLYTREYNVYLMNMLAEADKPEGIPLETLETTVRLEELYNHRMRTPWGASAVDNILKVCLASNSLSHCLIALHMEPKPHPMRLHEALKLTIISQFNDPTAEKMRMIEALIKNGAILPSNFGHTILSDLNRGKIQRFESRLFQWVVTVTEELFFLHNLRDFLEKNHCNSSNELLNMVDFLLQNMREYPANHDNSKRRCDFNDLLLQILISANPHEPKEKIVNIAKQETEIQLPQAECDAEEKYNKDHIITEIVEKCLTFEDSDELLDLLYESNLQGDCALNLIHMLKAVDKGVTIAPELAQFFSGDTAQAKLESMIFRCKETGVPSQPSLDLLATCGASIDEKFLIQLLDNEHPDEAVALALQIMTEKPTEESLRFAYDRKRFGALEQIIHAGAIPPESFVNRVILSWVLGQKPDLELLTLLVKSGATISVDTWKSAQAWDKMKGWDLEQTLVNAGATLPDELA